MSSIMRIKNEQGEWVSVVSLKGEGVQPGGLTGQYLVKKSNDDFDTEWASPTGGGDMLKSVYDPQGKNTDVFGYVDGKAQTLVNNAIGALTKSSVGLSNVDNVKQIPYSEKGANNGVAELDSTGKVLSSQLPSYVDDVLEYATSANFPATGETGKIYIAINTNLTYRWTGTAYTEVSPSIALGETSATAYRGDRGKIAYDHSQVEHAPANAQKNSDITKSEIEAKLTGAITTHTHGQYIEADKFQVVESLPASPLEGVFYFVKE